MKRLFLMSIVSLLALGAQSKIRLSHLLGDNMVLQQQTEARLWGWAKPKATVKVTTSWGAAVETQTADDGRWLAKVKTPKASMAPQTVTFYDGENAVTLKDVLIGEVWVCAGQSNMEMPVKGFGQCPVEGYNQMVLDAMYSKGVRSIKVPSVMSSRPLDDAQCEWRQCSPKTVGEFSATGYFFARLLSRTLDIPVGLIEANKGGSRVESWLTKENLQKFTTDPVDSVEIAKRWPTDYHRSLLWGNGTFNPILNYTVKGILFYQGCSNVGDPGNQYSERLKLLVEQWRTQFGLGEIPFYFVEIAPFHYDDVNADNAARLREQQYRASKIIPNSGLVCTNDLAYPYETTQIHPAQKKPYGMDAVGCMSMSFKDMRVVGDTVHIHVADDLGGISRFEDIQGFEIAGEDCVFHKATAEHFWQPGGGYWDETIRIFSPEVQNPVAVRYCFRNFQLGNLKNAAGLPLFPFRTDTW